MLFFDCNNRQTDKQTNKQTNIEILTHDFGIIQPNKSYSHIFKIYNTDVLTWRFDSYQLSCGCTLASISKHVLAPGEMTEVEVTYTSSGETYNDLRTIGVFFREESAPHFQLQISAKILDPITIFPRKLMHNRVIKGSVVNGHVVVCNYTTAKLSDPKPVNHPDWLHFAQPVSEPVSGEGETQRWRVPYHIETNMLITNLPESKFRFQFQFDSEMVISDDVTTSVDTIPPIEVVPSSVFFGKIKLGQSSRLKLIIRDNEGLHSTSKQKTFKLNHDLPGELETNRLTSNHGQEIWELLYTPKVKKIEIVGKLFIRSGDDTKILLELPILGKVE